MPTDGIDRLIAVTQLKSANANDNEPEGDDVQWSSVKRRRGPRPAEASIHPAVGDAMARASAEMKPSAQVLAVTESESPLAEIGPDASLEPSSEQRRAGSDDADPRP